MIARKVSTVRVAGMRVGLFETSTDVNNCAHIVGDRIAGLDNDIIAFFTKKYGPELFAGPSATKAELDRKLNDRAFYQQWRRFSDSYNTWKKDWDDSFGVLSADAYRECENFDQQSTTWYHQCEAKNIRPSVPLTPLKPPPKDKPDETPVSTWIAVGAAATVGLIVLIKVAL